MWYWCSAACIGLLLDFAIACLTGWWLHQLGEYDVERAANEIGKGQEKHRTSFASRF
jgi:hypothetical protein